MKSKIINIMNLILNKMLVNEHKNKTKIGNKEDLFVNYTEELKKVMDLHIKHIKIDSSVPADYLIGLLHMKGVVLNYLKDKEIVEKKL